MYDRQRRGVLVTFSGIDGAGKSTQIHLLQDRLAKQGLKSHYLRSRGGYTSGFKRLKSCLRRHVPGALPPSGHSPRRERQLKRRWVQIIWLTLAILDLMRVYGAQIRQWLRQEDIVICDRYIWDTLIDFQVNFPQVNVETWMIWKLLVWVTPKPDYAWFLRIPLEESIRRSIEKRDPFPESLDRRTLRHALYTEFADARKVWQSINAMQPPESIAKEIQAVMIPSSRG